MVPEEAGKMSSLSLHISMSLLLNLQWVSSRSASSLLHVHQLVAQMPGAEIMERPLPSSWSCCQNSYMWVFQMLLLLVQDMKVVHKKYPPKSTRQNPHYLLSLINHLTSFLHGHRPLRLKRWKFRSHPSVRAEPSSYTIKRTMGLDKELSVLE